MQTLWVKGEDVQSLNDAVGKYIRMFDAAFAEFTVRLDVVLIPMDRLHRTLCKHRYHGIHLNRDTLYPEQYHPVLLASC